MANNAAALARNAIFGLFRQNFMRGDGSLIRTAPPASTEYANKTYLVDDNSYEDPANDAAPFFDKKGHAMLDQNFSDVTFNIRARDLKGFIIPEHRIRIFSASNAVSLVDTATNILIRRAVADHAKDVIRSASTLTAISTPINLATVNTNIVEVIREAMRDINLATGLDPDTITMGRRAVDQLANTIQVQPSGGVAAGTGTVVKTGTENYEAVRTWFRRGFNLELAVVNSRQQTNAGVVEYLLEDEIYLTYHGTGNEDSESTFKTVYNPGSVPAGVAPDLRALHAIFRIDIRPTAPPLRVGLGVTGEAAYTIHGAYPASGRRIPVSYTPPS